MVKLAMLIGLILLATGCESKIAENRILPSPVVPFSDLFVAVDTVRLDTSVVIGFVGVLDVSEAGEFLVTDHVGRGIHRFSASGTHERSYSTASCLPDEGNFMLRNSRFLGGGRVMTMSPGGAAAVFDAEGNCIAASRQLESFSRAFCTSGDSIFVHRIYVEGQAAMGVYTPALEALSDLTIDPPRFVRLNQFFSGQVGKSVACFEDGPYYVYLESMDGIAIRSNPSITRYEPDFYEMRPNDLSMTDDVGARSTDRRAYASAISVFPLDASTRIVAFIDLKPRWRLGDNAGTRSIGLSIASNTDRFPGRSTISPVAPRAAGNGYLYAVGENELFPDGTVGNPVIIRYRFSPPASTVD